MFTENVIREVIDMLRLKELGEVIVSEKGSKVLNGLSFKESTLSFFIPSERDFYKLTSNPDAAPVDNFGIEGKQHFTIATRYGKIHFFNRYIDIDQYCDWDSHSKVYFFHEGYLRWYTGKKEFI